MGQGLSEGLKAFLSARQVLVECRKDYERARREFRWPELGEFNWALDYFDYYARDNNKTALWIVDEAAGEVKLSFEELSRRSNQVARFLRRQGVERGDRIILMLPNVAATWEVMLAAMKLGAVVIPAATLLTTEDLRDRLDRGKAKHVVAMAAAAERFSKLPGNYTRILADGEAAGWVPYRQAYDEPADFKPDGPTRATDPLLLYFTSGTTALPKLVLHTHESYPVGHLATMYWIGIRSGDVHMNISSPGWAKHAWSCFFAPWNAGATVFVHSYARFDAKATLSTIARCAVTTLCAPPTVWRMIVLEDLESYPVRLREVASAGEPLNPEVIEKVRRWWNLTIRDGYGQTENVCLLGNFPGQTVKRGALGKPSPGHDVVLLDLDGKEADDGEISLKLNPRPPSLMVGYMDDAEKTAAAMADGYYRTGDVAHRDADGYFTYVGRADDVFKSSDYRISPFELESALIEHAAVAEAAVVPSPDKLRWTVPKAFIVLKPGMAPSADVARDIFQFIRARLGPYKRIRRIEFAELPKTISGKIRRVELRGVEQEARKTDGRRPAEFWEEDFPEIK
ncbi:MAG TPA: AMP-binding protein [Patescibacteria group bacterium]|nr:AMP-binding protein [Patescibacteria group bacterium]